jgi:hypothetical protein
MNTTNLINLPEFPFPGINPYGYYERNVFFARKQEVRSLIRSIVIHRGVLLYSMSGIGKSSLINAGLISKSIEEGYQPERIRVQPVLSGEIIVERISIENPNAPPFLPSLFPFNENQIRLVLSVEEFLSIIYASTTPEIPLLIFDQFEEWVTLFESSDQYVRSSHDKILFGISKILNDSKLSIKTLITFREDYLAQMTPLFKLCPQLPDNYLRLTALNYKSIVEIIRGPFVTYPNFYRNTISEDIACEIKSQFELHNIEGFYLSELQIICQGLLEKKRITPDYNEKLYVKSGVKVLLENYLEQKVQLLPNEQKAAVIPLLNRMVTSAGTRNVILKDDLISRVSVEEDLDRELLEKTLNNLEQQIKLIRSEIRREVYYYELVSEFLIEWIINSYRSYEKEKAIEQLKEVAHNSEKKAREATQTARRFQVDMKNQVISNQRLSRLIGYIGLSLPFLLIFSSYIIDKSSAFQESISSYYYTGAHDIYVGIFVIIAMVLFIYKGYTLRDNIITNIGAVSVIIMGFFPSSPERSIADGLNSHLSSFIHFFFISIFFLTMAYISLFIFTKSAAFATRAKLLRNKVYRICGMVIILCLGILPMSEYFSIDIFGPLKTLHPVLFFETLAFFSFGVSWLVKGNVFFRDRTC